MTSFLIEIKCPHHGVERFRIKLIRKYNIKSNAIIPKFRRKPTNELSGLILGRNVKIKEAEEYLMRYFREVGITNSIISVKILK